MLALLNNRATIVGGRNLQLRSDNASFGVRSSAFRNSSGVDSDETIQMQLLPAAQLEEV
jgi:hypothetical protein